MMTVAYCPYGGGFCQAAGVDTCTHGFENLIQCQGYAAQIIKRMANPLLVKS